MFIQRNHTRYPAQAQVRIPHILGGEGLLKDLSITGCCIECTGHVDITPNQTYKIEIKPESAARIGKFDLTVECRWIQSGEDSWNIGCTISESPRGKPFQRYVDYLAWRSSTP